MLKRPLLAVLLCAPWLVSSAAEAPAATTAVMPPNADTAIAVPPSVPPPATTLPDNAPLKTNPLVHEYTLDNGLKLIVKEDHRAPVEVSQVWYKVGSSYEPTGITGISHVLEHMMFKGTAKHPPNDFSRIIAANGGEENAFTGRDYTAYYQTMEKSRLPISFELEADRMRNLMLSPDEFAKEIQVVMEERRLRTDDNPEALTDEIFNAVAFISSSYHHPVIGWMDDLINLKVEDVRQWYETWYAPNNATVVVVGDVNPDEVLALAKQHFGPLKPSKLVPPRPRRELEQTGIRRMTVKAPAELPYLIMGYQTPVLHSLTDADGKDADEDLYALDVLSSILSSGDSGWLSKYVVRGAQIAASASAGYSLFSRLQDMFMLDGTPVKGRTVDDVELALRQQIWRLQNEPVSIEDLARVKAQVVASDVYAKDSIMGQASQIGSLETVGLDWRLIDTYVDRINAVTADQVQNVARKYLIDDHLTIAVLDPQPIDPNKPPTDGGSALGGANVR